MTIRQADSFLRGSAFSLLRKVEPLLSFVLYWFSPHALASNPPCTSIPATPVFISCLAARNASWQAAFKAPCTCVPAFDSFLCQSRRESDSFDWRLRTSCSILLSHLHFSFLATIIVRLSSIFLYLLAEIQRNPPGSVLQSPPSDIRTHFVLHLHYGKAT